MERNNSQSKDSGLVDHLIFNILNLQINGTLYHYILGKVVMYLSYHLTLLPVHNYHKYMYLLLAFHL